MQFAFLVFWAYTAFFQALLIRIANKPEEVKFYAVRGGGWLVDGSNFLFRAYHALPTLSTRAGVPSGAVFGFTQMLVRARGIIMPRDADKQAAWNSVVVVQRKDLQPGDLLATGTPSGVGYARTPPWLLQPGDTVEVEVERLGIVRNTIVSNERRYCTE